MGRAVPIRDDRGEILKWVGTCTDIDEQKRGTELLEKTVADRTRELQEANAALLRDMEERRKLEEQLLQAQKMESIGVLAGGIAHDFNNILNIIQGYASTLSAPGVQSKQMEESLTVINKTVQRGSSLVQQLLTLARKNSLQLELVSINGLIQGLVSLIRQTFPKTIELGSVLEADLPPIRADRNQIEQALLNLCVNASDAMPDGGKLTFKTESVDGGTLEGLGDDLEARYVCVEVSDTGKGMEESVRERIFEPFFTTKEKNQGTGLGLSVVYGIVKNHNGLIDVKSKPNSGTAFRLYLPVADSENAGEETLVKSNIETAVAVNGAATVLVVEDERNMLSLLEKVLLKQGYRVLTASDGEKALEVYQQRNGTIDVVLLDIGLPKMAGEEVLQKMKQQNPNVKVVIASGYLDPELKARMDRAGVQYFLPKPYLPDKVIKILQGAIDANP
jgi:signal transduction histidine kinase/ActR/RegA family two-component response regulator